MLGISDDYVLIQGVEQVGDHHAIRPTTDPAYVWSRYLRPIERHEVPLLVQWTHIYDDIFTEKNYLKLEPAINSQNLEIVEGVFGNDLKTSNFHQILGARDYAKYVYKWGQLVEFSKGKIDETGNWGLHQQFFNFHRNLFMVLSTKGDYVLVTKASLYQNGIAKDPNFQPMWTWSRFLRLHSRLEFPRASDWSHPWEPEKPQEPPFGYYRFIGPSNKEE